MGAAVEKACVGQRTASKIAKIVMEIIFVYSSEIVPLFPRSSCIQVLDIRQCQILESCVRVELVLPVCSNIVTLLSVTRLFLDDTMMCQVVVTMSKNNA